MIKSHIKKAKDNEDMACPNKTSPGQRAIPRSPGRHISTWSEGDAWQSVISKPIHLYLTVCRTNSNVLV